MSAPSVPSAALAKAFAHVETWVFDLDNTLYPHGANLWEQVDGRITTWIAHHFGLDGLAARALQKHYYRQHGTSLRGLMLEEGLEPADFLDFVHAIDHSPLEPNPTLGAAIASLPGRKLILTNGSRGHAEAVARRLGVWDHFEDAFDIVAADYLPKPARATYERFLDRHGIDPTRAAMFEDLARNLEAPFALGMETVLVVPNGAVAEAIERDSWEREGAGAPHIRHVTDDLAGFLAPLGRVLPKLGLEGGRET